MKRITTAIAVVLSLGVLGAPAAQAHVTVQPESVAAGGFERLDVRVPNERDNAATEKVEVKLPDGFLFVSYEPVPGWTAQVKTERLAQPAEAFGEEITEQVSTVTFTADSPADAIGPGQFRDFGLSVGMPQEAAAGETLTFPAIQTYDNGEVVRWIEGPDGEAPAAQVALTEGEEAHDEEADEPVAEAADDSDDESDGAPTWLAVLGVILGALGLVAGGAALRKR